MGGPKAFLPGPDGRPLVVAALDALRAAGADPVRVVARDAAATAAFAALGVEVLHDRVAGEGPLRGIEAALAAAPGGWTLVVACDMPRLDAALLADLGRRALASTAAAVVPRVAGRAEPLHAAWHGRALPPLAAALAAGRRGVGDLLATLEVEWVDLAPQPSFDNWNRPEDRAESPYPRRPADRPRDGPTGGAP